MSLENGLNKLFYPFQQSDTTAPGIVNVQQRKEKT